MLNFIAMIFLLVAMVGFTTSQTIDDAVSLSMNILEADPELSGPYLVYSCP